MSQNRLGSVIALLRLSSVLGLLLLSAVSDNNPPDRPTGPIPPVELGPPIPVDWWVTVPEEEADNDGVIGVAWLIFLR